MQYWRFAAIGLFQTLLVNAHPAIALDPSTTASSIAGQTGLAALSAAERHAEAIPETDRSAVSWECTYGSGLVRIGRLSFCRIALRRQPAAAQHDLLRYRILVEEGLEDLSQSFVDGVNRILNAPSGWARAGIRFQHVERGHDITVLVARPRSVDRLCYPLRTRSQLSCAIRGRAIINAWRWQHGATTWQENVEGYRHYLVNHEVGHLLGAYHTGCPKAGEPAPIMLQQTKFLRRCAANGEVTERDLAMLKRLLPVLERRLSAAGPLRLRRRPYARKRWRKRRSRRYVRRKLRRKRTASICRKCRRRTNSGVDRSVSGWVGSDSR